jgi:uncharacterized protein (DUF433 family)
MTGQIGWQSTLAAVRIEQGDRPMILPATLTQDDLGLIHVTDHRVTLDDLLHFYQQGESAEMLQARFPTLSLEQCQASILFYQSNEAEVDAYLEEGRQALAKQRALSAGRGPSLEELKRRRAKSLQDLHKVPRSSKA